MLEITSKILLSLKRLLRHIFFEVIDELDIDDIVEDLIPKQKFKRKKRKERPRSRKTKNRVVKKIQEQISYQKEQTEQLLGTVELTLIEKLSPTEITYSRYKNASERVADAIQQNINLLNHKATILEGLDYKEISSRFKKLEREQRKRNRGNQENESVELKTLKERKTNIEELSIQIKDLFFKNNQGLIKLEELAIALAQLNISAGKEVSSFEESIEDLDVLIEQVDLYDTEESSNTSKKTKPEKIKI